MDLYKRSDKDLLPMPKKPDRSIDPSGIGFEGNDVDVLRHAFISGVYILEYNELKDNRKYKGEKITKRLQKIFVFKIKENKKRTYNEFLDVRKKLVLFKSEFIEAIKNRPYPGYIIRKHHSGESTRDRFILNNLV